MGERECVYFIQSGPGGPIKIGKSTGDAQDRVASLQTGNPVEMRLILSIPGSFALESSLHSKFSAHRIHGEWFRPAREILTYIEQKATMQAPVLSARIAVLEREKALLLDEAQWAREMAILYGITAKELVTEFLARRPSEPAEAEAEEAAKAR